MPYKRRHQVIRFIPRVRSQVGAAIKALNIIDKAELSFDERRELDDAVEDLWILVDKLRAKESK